jgi:hypothetical protein
MSGTDGDRVGPAAPALSAAPAEPGQLLPREDLKPEAELGGVVLDVARIINI